MKKRFMAILLVVVLVLMVGCGTDAEPTVELTIPKDYIGNTTQEELNKTAEDKGYEAITLNSDGSATYVMTESKHKAMMDEIQSYINNALADMVNSGDYKYLEIKTNENFTDFTVTTAATELETQDSVAVMGFYMFGGMYNSFSGDDVDNIHVSFINVDTKEVISEANSKDMQK